MQRQVFSYAIAGAALTSTGCFCPAFTYCTPVREHAGARILSHTHTECMV